MKMLTNLLSGVIIGTLVAMAPLAVMGDVVVGIGGPPAPGYYHHHHHHHHHYNNGRYNNGYNNGYNGQWHN